MVVRQIEGVDVALQDQGGPDCDLNGENVQGPFPVLTSDCRILYPAQYSGHRPTPPADDYCGR